MLLWLVLSSLNRKCLHLQKTPKSNFVLPASTNYLLPVLCSPTLKWVAHDVFHQCIIKHMCLSRSFLLSWAHYSSTCGCTLFLKPMLRLLLQALWYRLCCVVLQVLVTTTAIEAATSPRHIISFQQLWQHAGNHNGSVRTCSKKKDEKIHNVVMCSSIAFCPEVCEHIQGKKDKKILNVMMCSGIQCTCWDRRREKVHARCNSAHT